MLLHFNFPVFSARSLFVFILSEMRFQLVLWCCLVGLVEFIIIIVYKIDGLWCGCGVVLKKWRKGSDQMVPWVFGGGRREILNVVYIVIHR